MHSNCGSFSRQQRLLRPTEFKRVFADAVRVGTQQLTLLARPNGTAVPRLGLAIAKRHVKSAVARNRIKRQVRESFRLHQHQLGGIDIVVLAKSAADKADRKQMRSQLDGRWRALVQRCANS